MCAFINQLWMESGLQGAPTPAGQQGQGVLNATHPPPSAVTWDIILGSPTSLQEHGSCLPPLFLCLLLPSPSSSNSVLIQNILRNASPSGHCPPLTIPGYAKLGTEGKPPNPPFHLWPTLPLVPWTVHSASRGGNVTMTTAPGAAGMQNTYLKKVHLPIWQTDFISCF